jgi:hypothetical protein
MRLRCSAFTAPVALLALIVLQPLPGVAAAADQLTVQAKELVRLKGCGRDAEPVDATLRLDDPSAWSLTLMGVTPGATTLGGSYVVGGRHDRKVTLETDAAGMAALTARAAALATQLCGAETGVDSLDIKAFKLVRGRKSATLKLAASFVAATGKRGRLKLKGKGVLESVATTTTTVAPTTSSTMVGTSSSSTTVTTTTSTTTTTDECVGKADDTPCTNDTNICSQDLCRNEVCTHDTPYPNAPFITCRQANGSACDVADSCQGTLCPDRKQTQFDFCQPLVPATYACNQVAGYVFCNGAQDDCPPERHCGVGEACNADDECVTGICVGGLCTADKSDIGGVCDTDADCIFGPVSFSKCENGVCRGALNNQCTTDDQCLSSYVCDAGGSGRCRLPIGAPCDLGLAYPDFQCAGGEMPPWLDDRAVCDPLTATCLSLDNEPCERDSECLDGYCSCGRLQSDGGAVLDFRCVPPGVCKLPPGHACTEDSQCPGSFDAGITLADGACFNGTCTTYLRHGEVCETDPPGGGPRCSNATSTPCTSVADCPPGGTCAFRAPQLGDSPNDELCGETGEYCFKSAAGDNGPCTPEGSVCGGPLNPEDYVCCRNLGGACSSDVDCCGLYLAPGRGCGSAGTCRVLVNNGGPCVTSADCLRQSTFRGPLQCTNGTCQPPPVVLPKGSPCDPAADPNVTHCDAGLTCFNCQPEGRGYRCADAASPCCRAGGPDYQFCGEKVVNGFTYDNQCCNYTCYQADDDQNCGTCGNDCTTNGGNACVTQPGQCVLDDLGVRCERQIDESICANSQGPPPPQLIHCVSLGDNPPLAVCEPYTPSSSMVDWSGLVLCEGNPVGAECTTDAQCCSCSCVQSNSSVTALFNFDTVSGAIKSCRCP